MIASTDATRPLEEIAQAASGPLWFQLYIYGSLEIAAGLVRRAEAAGYQAIVLTVDLPVMGIVSGVSGTQCPYHLHHSLKPILWASRKTTGAGSRDLENHRVGASKPRCLSWSRAF